MCVHRESGAQRAVKVLRKSHMDEDEKRMLFNEINILKEIVSGAFHFIPRSGSSRWINFILSSCLTKFAMFRITPISSRCTSSSKTTSATTWLLSKFHFIPPIG